ncbi:MAG: hypothetical protein MHM6MM_008560, partial [Cercozoa sp. M6MM]
MKILLSTLLNLSMARHQLAEGGMALKSLIHSNDEIEHDLHSLTVHMAKATDQLKASLKEL